MQGVLDYRAAMLAKSLFNGENKEQSFSQLAANPRLLEVLAMMRRAQDGLPLAGEMRALEREGMAVADGYRDVRDEEA